MPKYEDAFYNKTQTLISLEELHKILKSNWLDYDENYRNHIFCDECHLAPLTMVKNDFLRALRNAKHEEWCSKIAAQISHEKLKKVIDTPKNREIINQKLQKAVGVMLENKSIESNNNPFVINLKKINTNKNINVNSKYKSYQLQKKSINRPLYDEDLYTFKIFYGKVYLKWGDANNSLIVISPKTKKIICRIWINENVYKYLPNEIKNISSNQLKYISFFAEIKKKNSYFNVRLMHSNLLVVV